MKPLVTCLWFDGRAMEAAEFYVSLIPNSRIGAVTPYPAEAPGAQPGQVMTVEFELNGQPFIGLNGGAMYQFSEAISLQIACADQAEIDRCWDALTADGGEPGRCGWCKDRFGLSWQVTPEQLPRLLKPDNPARARAVMDAFMGMDKFDIAALEAAGRDA